MKRPRNQLPYPSPLSNLTQTFLKLLLQNSSMTQLKDKVSPTKVEILKGLEVLKGSIANCSERKTL